MKRMNMNYLLTLSAVCLLTCSFLNAQVKTQTSTSQDQSTVHTQVERGEVVYVSGNDVVVKMENGELRNYPNVPDTAKINVNGQDLTVHDLKPGMKLERTITTTTTPQTVTTVKSVTGTVWHVSPPSSVILRLEDGSNEKFSIPAGQKFNVDGQEVDAFHLKKGMKISATKVVAEPQTVSHIERKVTGEMPPAPDTSAMQGPVLIVVAPSAQHQQVAQATPPENPAQAEAPAQAEHVPAPKKLPQTASQLPLLGLMGVLLLVFGVAGLSLWSRNG